MFSPHPIPEALRPLARHGSGAAVQPHRLGTRSLLKQQGLETSWNSRSWYFPFFFFPSTFYAFSRITLWLCISQISASESRLPELPSQATGLLETTKFPSKYLPRQLFWKLHEKNPTWEAEKVQTAEKMRSQADTDLGAIVFNLSLSNKCFFLHRVAIVSDFCGSLAAGYQDIFISPDDFMVCTELIWLCTAYAITPYILNQL